MPITYKISTKWETRIIKLKKVTLNLNNDVSQTTYFVTFKYI